MKGLRKNGTKARRVKEASKPSIDNDNDNDTNKYLLLYSKVP